MFFKNKNLVALILAVIILSVPISVSATVPVSTGYKGPGQTVFVVMHYEDASAIRHIQAKLEQDLIALEQAFAKLQNDGVLDPDFPRLVIVATKYYEVGSRFEMAPTVLSFTNSASLVCTNPDLPQFDPEALGSAYVIKTTTGLLSYSDLAALMLLLGELNHTAPTITIDSQHKLLAAKTYPAFEGLMNLQVTEDESGIVSGGLRISALWSSGKAHYSLIDEGGNTIADLKPVDISIGRPSWPPVERTDMQGRLIAYASKDQAIIYDIAEGEYHKLSLDFEFEDAGTREIVEHMGDFQSVQFAMHAEENKVYVLPFGTMGMISVAYSLDLDTGEWLRELEGELISDEVRKNRDNGVWLDFVPALSDRSLRNVDILTKEWTKGQDFPVVNADIDQTVTDEQPAQDVPAVSEEPPIKEEPAQETETTGAQRNNTGLLWLLLLLFLAAAILLVNRRRRKA